MRANKIGAFVLGAAFIGASLSLPTVPAIADEEMATSSNVDWAEIPTSEDAIRPLNDKQLDSLRRYAGLCGDMAENLQDSTCVIGGLDHYIRFNGSPEMVAFHFGMMPNIRYDMNRTLTRVMEQLMPRREAGLKAEGASE